MTEKIQSTINQAVLAPAEALFGLKFHQVAIYTNDVHESMRLWRNMGYTDWHEDKAMLVGTDRGVLSTKLAHMVFNYDIMPLELEFVSYNGPRNNMDERDGSVPFLSHLSTIVDDIDEVKERLSKTIYMDPYHEFVTHGHTNPNVVGKKRFKEAIYDTTPVIGFDIKLIQRVPWDYQ